MEIQENTDHINLSESYFDEIYQYNNIVSIPLISIQIMESYNANMFNGRAYYSKFGGLLLFGVHSLTYQGPEGQHITIVPAISDQTIRNEFEFSFEHISKRCGIYARANASEYKIILPASSDYSLHPWIPKKTPNFSSNMDVGDFDTFKDELEKYLSEMVITKPTDRLNYSPCAAPQRTKNK